MRYMRNLLVCLLLMFFSNASLQAQLKLPNPILPGFYPDPSICKVGGDYYLICSTFSYFPGIPVFHSLDLKNWKQLGNVIDRPSQMDFKGDQVSQGLFAPAISYHKGTFYVTCTDINGGGNFVVTTKNPAGPWSDPVWIKEVNGIDPSLFFDGDKAYIVYNSRAPDSKPLYDGHRTLRMFEFDPLTLKVKGAEILLVNGGVDISKKPVWIEGPHIYKRNGYYYLMAAEGGTSVNHSEVILRSKDVNGPYIPYEKNPILTQRHLDANRPNSITSAGHADLVEGPDGNTYAVFLAVRPYEGNHYNIGRETFIAPVKWTDGWPVINPENQEIKYEYPVSWKEVQHKGSVPFNGSFSHKEVFKDSLKSHFLFLRTHNPEWYSFKAKKSGLTLNLLPETVMGRGTPAFIGRRQQHLVSSAATEMNFSAGNENEKAGLIIFQNESHFYYICKSVAGGNDVVQFYKGGPEDKGMTLVNQVALPRQSERIFLKIEANRDKYSFLYALEDKKWSLLQDNVDGKFLSTQTAGGFVGSILGMYATSGGAVSQNKVSFKWLEYWGDDISDRTKQWSSK